MLARVFPVQNARYSPDDDDVYFDAPGLFVPEYDEVRVSCLFSWDRARAEFLARQWDARFPGRVTIGGPAYFSSADTFEPGLYVHRDVLFTSRGCPNRCSFCFVPKIEGGIRELPIPDDTQCGYIINDNNFLACSREHRERVYAMLRRRGKADFRGGLESRLFTEWDAEQMCSLSEKVTMFFACDTPKRLKPLKRALDLVKQLKRVQKRCYVLIGHADKTPLDAWDRIVDVARAGAWPHPQLYRALEDKKTQHSKMWQLLQSAWCNWVSASGAIRYIDAGDDIGLEAYRDRVLNWSDKKIDSMTVDLFPADAGSEEDAQCDSADCI